MEVHAFRLTPGQDLKKSLVAYAKGEKLEAGCIVTCVGSLKKVRHPRAIDFPRCPFASDDFHDPAADRDRTPPLAQICLRLANATATNKNETVSLQERFEIVSLTGTVSRHGCHLHVALADHQGNVVGGHVLEGCEVFTTAEIVIGECVNHVVSREHDEETGFDELVVTTKLSMQVPKRRSNSVVSMSSVEQSDSPALRQRSNASASNRGSAADDEFTFAPAPVSDVNADANLDRRHDGVDAAVDRFVNDAVSSLGPRRDFRASGGGSREMPESRRRVEHEPAPMAQLTDWRAKDARRERQRLRRIQLEEEAARARGENPPRRGILGWLGSLIAPEPEPASPPREAEGGEVRGAEEGGEARNESND